MARAPLRVPATGWSAAWSDPLSEAHSSRGMRLIPLATYPFASEYSKGEKLVGSEVSPDFSMTNVMGERLMRWVGLNVWRVSGDRFRGDHAEQERPL
jgi:hypothetical protein